MFVEATKMSGTGELLLTGQLGMDICTQLLRVEASSQGWLYVHKMSNYFSIANI